MKNIYTEDMKEITTSSSILKELITYDMVYVDKTSYIWRMVRNPARNFYFISRPRRFGKSLFCDTLKNVFEGNKELFRGLYIYDKHDFEPYPVLSFNFANVSSATFGNFMDSITKAVRKEAERNGVDIELSDNPAEMLQEALIGIYEKTGKGSVIIIDEYDNNLTSTIGEAFAEDIRKVLNDFYKRIKNNSQYIRFCFITGVVKLSNLSIFSAMNNLVDLSMDKEFSGAFGYTDEELDEYFGEGIDEYLEANPRVYESREEFREKIRDYYDGYRFSPESETRVYNPVSIGFFFYKECTFSNYWDKTGNSSFAVELARRHNLKDILIDDSVLSEFALSSFDISDINNDNIPDSKILAMLYQTGYLTIKDYNELGYTLKFPNMEVSSTFSLSLIGRYIGNEEIADNLSGVIKMACRLGDAAMMMDAIEKYFAAFPYGDEKPDERTYQGRLYGLFAASLRKPVSREVKTSNGRIDLVIASDKDIWIFELKVDKSADAALRQIDEKDYASAYGYLFDSHKIHKIGISFSSKTRRVAEWKLSS